MTAVHSTFFSSVRGAAASSFVTECQNVQSQDIFSCHCITRDASEKNMCSASAACELRKDSLKVSNCKIKCGNTSQDGNHCSQRPEGFVEKSTLLESEPAGREVQSSFLEGKVRSAVAAAVTHTASLNTATHSVANHSNGNPKESLVPITGTSCVASWSTPWQSHAEGHVAISTPLR